MKKLFMLMLVAVVSAVLAGCYTGEMTLAKRFIREPEISAFREDGRTYLRVRGISGMPMGVCRSVRHVEGNVMYLDLIISESQSGDLRIDEQFVIPDRVNKVKMGDDIIWDRDGGRTQSLPRF